MRDRTPDERAARISRVATAHGLSVSQVLLGDGECPAAVVKFSGDVDVICEDDALPEALFVVRIDGAPISAHADPLPAVAAAIAAQRY